MLISSPTLPCSCKLFVKIRITPLTSLIQGPAKKWEEVLLGLGVEGSKAGIEGEEIAPLAKENVATP
jgi:hypothetical protein